MSLRDTLLITVDNDAESRLIFQIALAYKMSVYRSAQPHGATLDQETGIVEFIQAVGRPNVWTVEIPGLETEARIKAAGFELTIIDHHVYKTLDRAHAPDGTRLKSSLEQFLHLAGISETSLSWHHFNPKLVLGVAIMDDRYVQGLRKANYTPQEIKEVLAYREQLEKQVDSHYNERFRAATQAFLARMEYRDVIIYQSDNDLSVSRLVSTLAIDQGLEAHPSIILGRGGKQVFFLNITRDQVTKLNTQCPNRHTWIYGAGHCWGLDNEKSDSNLRMNLTAQEWVDLLQA